MATWQFDAAIVPRLVEGQLRAALRPFEDRDAGLWCSVSPAWAASIARGLGLQATASWRSDLSIWGELDGTCVQQFIEAGTIEDVSLRIDMRAANEEFARRLCEALKAHGAMLFTASGLIMPPEFDDVRRALKGSDAARFVADPGAFLDSQG